MANNERQMIPTIPTTTETKIERKDRLTLSRTMSRRWDNSGRTGAFESFIVVRRYGADVEVHTLGASGNALDELVDMIHATIVDAMLSAHGTGAPLDDEEIDLQRIGRHVDAPTGIRVTNFDDAHKIADVLGNTFDNVMVAS